MTFIYENWYGGQRFTTYATREAQLKAAYDYLKNHPTSKIVVNCDTYKNGKQITNTAAWWGKVDGRKQIVFTPADGYPYILKSDGTLGKRLRREFITDSNGLIRDEIYFSR